MYTVTASVPFDLVLDTDIGLWKLIQNQYHNSIFFNKGVLDIRDLNVMKYLITQRDEYNPMTLFLKKEYIKDADSLYDEFIDREYFNILKYSSNTGIFDMIRRTGYIDDIMKMDIICDNDRQEKEIKERFDKYKIQPRTIINDNLSSLDMTSYGSIYVKKYKDILKYPILEGKNIIIGRYKFNFEKKFPDIPLQEITNLLMATNVVQMVDVHAIDERKLPLG